MRLFYTFVTVTLTTLLMSCDRGAESSSSSSGVTYSSPPKTLSTGIDSQVKVLMQQSGATAATIAIAKNGEIEYEQAYGFQDANKTIELQPDALMRSASIVKPVTAAAIRKLAESGMLALSDHVFCDGNNTPCWLPADLLSTTSDSRAKEITIEYLVAHQGGWYADISGDPLEQEVEIRDLLNLTGPPTREDIVRFVMKRPLDYTPGIPDYVHHSYSNFGYLLLGMIVELAAQTSYLDYVHLEIMGPLGVGSGDFKIAESRFINHDVREPNYISTDICPSVFTLDQLALCVDEGADNNNWFSALGVVSTASAMALFAQHYSLPTDYKAGYGVTGKPLSSFKNGVHGGSLPGLSSMLRQLPSGVSYAIFLNVSFNLEPALAELDRRSQLAP